MKASLNFNPETFDLILSGKGLLPIHPHLMMFPECKSPFWPSLSEHAVIGLLSYFSIQDLVQPIVGHKLKYGQILYFS